MGQFSWISVDTDEPIYNDKPAGTQTVTMVYKDQDGDIQRVTETNYEGYGEFGGIDFYDAVAWMNNITPNDNTELRELGIDFYFSENPSGVYPQLFLDTPPSDDKIDFSVYPEHDPNQGWSHYESDRDYDEFDTYRDYEDDDYWDDDEDEDEWDEEEDDDEDFDDD